MTTAQTTPNTNSSTTTSAPTKSYAQKLAFYHPNSAGNGVAMQLEPRINRKEDDRYNCFFLELAAQKTAATRNGEKKAPATFDWEHKLTVKLDFTDICEILTVLEGRVEKAGGQRNGLYHQNGASCTLITFQKNTEKGGYLVGLSKKGQQDGQAIRLHICLSESEAIGLRCIFQTSLFFLTFHRTIYPEAA
jgi:hypothetical protein